MKRFVLFLPYLLLFSGCAQVFDGNLFKSVDTPPALDANTLASESDATVVTQITTDSSFLTRLQSNSAALAAVQSVLSTAYSATGASTTTVITDAQAYITASTGGSTAGAVVTSALAQAKTLSAGASASAAASAMQAIFAGQTAAQIQANLQQFQNISGALSAMQTAATTGSTVSSSIFFQGSTSKLNLAVTAALAATVNAFVADVGMSALVNDLVNGTTPSSSGAKVTMLANALSGSGSDPSTNSYAYLTAVTGLVKT